MLAIRCAFLQGTYQAAAPGRHDHPEWPPHPARLHAALLAAGWAIGDGERLGESERDALRWLDQAGAPDICAPAASSRSLAPVFVPRNLTSRELGSVRSAQRGGRGASVGRQIGRTERVFPTTVPGDEPVWFCWRDTTPLPAVREALERLVAEVAYLGSSRSPVRCDLVIDGEAPEATLVPLQGRGEQSLRVAVPGLTDAMVASRDDPSSGLLGALTGYGRPVEREAAAPRGPFGDLVVMARTRGFGVTIEHTGLLTRAFRAAVLSQAGDDAPAILHGHGRNPHAAFLALPNVGHPNSTGEILGLAVAIPADATPEERAAIVGAARRVRVLNAHQNLAPWELRPVDEAPDRRTLDPLAWVGPATRWHTVTPVVLDSHPKPNRGETLADAVTKTLINGLVPVPIDVQTSTQPWVPGAVSARMYAGHGLPTGQPLHVQLTFERPVAGPLLAGRARYFGVGLLRPASAS